MSFNELNSVEYFIIHRLTGVNLNNVREGMVAEEAVEYGDGVKWRYVQSELLQRNIEDVLLEKELTEALCRLNPEIAAHPERAEEVIHKLRAILITVNNVGLVRANEEFSKWLRGEMTLPFGKRDHHIPIRLIDFEDLKNNTYILTNQLPVRARETKIPDIVCFVNGIPLVVGEAKTPVRPAVSWLDGAHDIHVTYENSIPQFFVPNVFSFATEGKELFIGAVRTPLECWTPWRLEDDKDELEHFAGLQNISKQLTHLLTPSTLLDILQHYTVYATNNQRRKIKVVLPLSAIRGFKCRCAACQGWKNKERFDLAFSRFREIFVNAVCRSKTTKAAGFRQSYSINCCGQN